MKKPFLIRSRSGIVEALHHPDKKVLTLWTIDADNRRDLVREVPCAYRFTADIVVEAQRHLDELAATL